MLNVSCNLQFRTKFIFQILYFRLKFCKVSCGEVKVFVAPEVLPSYPIHMCVNKKLLGKTNVTNENTGISRGKLEKHREYINMSLSNLIIVYIV